MTNRALERMETELAKMKAKLADLTRRLEAARATC